MVMRTGHSNQLFGQAQPNIIRHAKERSCAAARRACQWRAWQWRSITVRTNVSKDCFEGLVSITCPTIYTEINIQKCKLYKMSKIYKKYNEYKIVTMQFI